MVTRSVSHEQLPPHLPAPSMNMEVSTRGYLPWRVLGLPPVPHSCWLPHSWVSQHACCAGNDVPGKLQRLPLVCFPSRSVGAMISAQVWG